jgi:hypothetical protein
LRRTSGHLPAAEADAHYGCRKDENHVCPGRVRIAAEPLEAYIEGYVIEMWKSPRALNIAQSDQRGGYAGAAGSVTGVGGPLGRGQTALTEMLVDKIVIYPHPRVMDAAGNRHYTIRAIPYQDPEREAARLKAVHEARVKIVPRVWQRRRADRSFD